MKKATPKQVAMIYNELESVTEVVDGKCRYLNGASDETLAEKLGVKVSSVTHIRLTEFGKLESQTSKSLTQRVTDLEEKVKWLESLFCSS